MSKSFFVVFFMYFFVVQSAIFGIVRGEPRFYLVGLINLIFILLMIIFYKHFEQTSSSKKEEEIKSPHTTYSKHYINVIPSRKQHSSYVFSYLFVLSLALLLIAVFDKTFFHILPISIWRFALFYFIMLFLSAKKLLDKKIFLGKMAFLPKDFLFWTSLIIVIAVYGSLTFNVFVFKILFSLLVGFIFFFVGILIVRENSFGDLFKFFFTRLYFVVISICFLILVFQGVSSVSMKQKIFQDFENIQFLFTSFESDRENKFLTGINVSSQESGQILFENLNQDTSLIGVSGDFSTGNFVVSTSGEVLQEVYSGLSSGNLQSSLHLQSGLAVSGEKLPLFPTLMDILIYLMDHYNIPLSSEKNKTFTYVTPKNPYYAQFRTAYDMKLIGYNANPSKPVLCQTYIVMKGLLEHRGLENITGDIKLIYRNEAKKRGVLNGCKWNFYVKNINL